MITLFPYGEGIFALDSGYVRPLMDAIHLIIDQGEAAVVDTGTNDSVQTVLDALDGEGVKAENVKAVILTHVHLDHAGGAGLLMSKLPNATLYVHPRGARHMIDPTKLAQGTAAVYGAEKAQAMYGTLLPVAASRVVEAVDGFRLKLGRRELTFYDTPGHARHHNCVHDSLTGHLFTGDMFGLSYREFDRDGKQFVFPATTPVQFDPAAFHASIDRMMELSPAAVYMTHFGQVTDVPRIASDLLTLVDLHADLGRRARSQPDEKRLPFLKQGVQEIVLAEKAKQNWNGTDQQALQVLEVDIALNAAGLLSWIESAPA